MKVFVSKFLNILFVLILIAIIGVNILYFPFKGFKVLFYSFLIILVLLGIIVLYRKKIIKKEVFYLIMAILLLIGIIIRLYFINNLSFTLASDFELAFSTGTDIANGLVPTSADYLSYNGYFYVFSYLVSLVFKVFGVSLQAVLYTNVVLQLLSVYFLYKIISLKASRETSIFLAIVYFLIPSIICINLLVTTENPFMLMMFICIYMALKIIDKKELKLLNLVLFASLGIILCFTNYIRPAILVFLIAYIIYYLINMKHFKEIIFIIVLVLTYSITNVGFTSFIENGLEQSIRAGATGWGVYYGTNYEHNGAWNLDDGEFINEVLVSSDNADKELIVASINRLKDYGLIKSSKLMVKKFKNLWTDESGVFNFVNAMVDTEHSNAEFAKYEGMVSNVNQLLLIALCIASIIEIRNLKNKLSDDWLVLKIFGLIYVISNLFICVNGRYSLPLYPVLVICSAILVDKMMFKSIEEN